MELTAARRLAAHELDHDWATNPRWAGVERPYSGADVVALRGSVGVEHTLARLGADRLWELMATRPFVAS